MDNQDKIKKYFLINILLIVIVGIIMVFSASYISSKESFGSSTYFVYKQGIFMIIGVILALFIRSTKMTFWYKNIYFFNGVASFLLMLTLTPLGKTIKG